MAGDLTLLVTTAETKQHTHNIEHTILSKLLRTHCYNTTAMAAIGLHQPTSETAASNSMLNRSTSTNVIYIILDNSAF